MKGGMTLETGLARRETSCVGRRGSDRQPCHHEHHSDGEQDRKKKLPGHLSAQPVLHLIPPFGQLPSKISGVLSNRGEVVLRGDIADEIVVQSPSLLLRQSATPIVSTVAIGVAGFLSRQSGMKFMPTKGPVRAMVTGESQLLPHVFCRSQHRRSRSPVG